MDLNDDVKLKAKNNLSVLFVEDEVTITLAFTNVLKRRFKTVYKAENGEKGIELFKLHKPDIVFTDILMPKMNGLKMISIIKEIDPNVPIIVMTALTERSCIDKAE
ncbi:MAG: response regulator, partial [Candidatus Magnetoovum sp. WYHC-5]|nr:response regulator [Candidatus Magnetoovum sp. WYHC-5]